MESKFIVLTNFTKCPLKDYKNLLILYLLLMACQVGYDPTTFTLEGYCSIQLSYRQILLILIALTPGFEPGTCGLTVRRSTN